MEKILFREVTPSDSSQLIQLIESGFGTIFTKKFVQWKYFENPAGQVYGWCAEQESHCIGFNGNIPVRLKVGEQTLLGAQAVDAVVDKRVRRQGVFIHLANESYRQMDQDDITLTYAFPNSLSLKTFLEHLGWSFVGYVPRYVKLLSSQRNTTQKEIRAPRAWLYRMLYEYTRLGSRQQSASTAAIHLVQEISKFDDSVNTLWQSVEKDFSLAVVRDVSYLNWRYVANPMGNYRIFSVEEDANFRGFMVLSLRDVKLGGAIAILELLVKPGDKEAGLALLKTAELIGEQIGAARIYCWMLPSHNFYMQLLKQSGFMFRPFGGRVSFLSSVTPFIIRTHSEEDWRKIEPIQLANWFVSMGDHDYY